MKRFTFILILLSLLSQGLIAQELAITGEVKNKSGTALSGVSIINNLTKKTITVTDKNGRFTAKVIPKTNLLFHLLGYGNAFAKISTGKTNYLIELVEEVNRLDEAVVVGYVARKRETLTGSAVTISGKEIQDVPVANFTDLLQGKVPGMNVQLNNGTPGIRGSVAIRGISTLNVQGSGDQAFLTPTSPLFVIDGVPIDEVQIMNMASRPQVQVLAL